MSKHPAEAAKKKPRPPQFPDGKFFHDVPLFDMDFLKPNEQSGSEESNGSSAENK